jgi:serine/threonine protein kinase
MESLETRSHERMLGLACDKTFSLINEEMETIEPASSRLGDIFVFWRSWGTDRFCTVCRVRDTERDRAVTVKTPGRSRIGADEASQFIREAQVAAQLTHANIISDFADGITLSDWHEQYRPTSRKSARMCVRIADALEHAHQAAVIHRDMKLYRGRVRRASSTARRLRSGPGSFPSRLPSG